MFVRYTYGMKLRLADIKVHATRPGVGPAFIAVLHVDRVRAATVSNDGLGGTHHYQWHRPRLRDRVEAWARKQPVPFPFEHLDQVIEDLLARHRQ